MAERAWRAIGTGILWEHTAVPCSRSCSASRSGRPLRILTGTALGKSVLIERVLSPYIVAAQAVPILALAPLLDIWFGGGLLARVAICALIVFFPIAIATMVGIRSTDPLLTEMLRSLGATDAQRTRLLEIPSALPVIFGGLRVGVTLAVIGAVVAGGPARAPGSASSLISPTRGSSTPRYVRRPHHARDHRPRLLRVVVFVSSVLLSI